MRLIIFALCGLLLVQCQKQYAPSDNIITADTIDSLVGRWKYLYDYKLTTTQTSPEIVLDSTQSTNFTPFSYLEVKADSTYKWYRSERKTLPAFGGGYSGHFQIVDSVRKFIWIEEFETSDDFATTTAINPPRTGPGFKIKYLSNDSLVLYFKTGGSDPTKNYYWYDVYKR